MCLVQNGDRDCAIFSLFSCKRPPNHRFNHCLGCALSVGSSEVGKSTSLASVACFNPTQWCPWLFFFGVHRCPFWLIWPNHRGRFLNQIPGKPISIFPKWTPMPVVPFVFFWGGEGWGFCSFQVTTKTSVPFFPTAAGDPEKKSETRLLPQVFSCPIFGPPS